MHLRKRPREAITRLRPMGVGHVGRHLLSERREVETAVMNHARWSGGVRALRVYQAVGIW
jgi:hypothetical protein